VTFAEARRRLVVPLSFWERFTKADPGLMAAAVAFNVFFALVPSAFAFLAGASFIGRDQDALDRVRTTLERVLVPPEIVDFIVADVIGGAYDLLAGQQGWVIALSLAVALISGSRGVVALQKALARIEGMQEDRRVWRVRLIAIGLTLAAGVSLAVASVSLLTGRRFFEFLQRLSGVEQILTVWTWARIPVAGVFLYGFLYAVYRWGPPRPFPWAWLAALVSTAAATVASLAFGFYLRRFGLANTLGVLGSFAVALLWLYVGAYMLLLSAAAVGFGFGRRVDRSAT
jgi:membrane protein